MKTYKVHDIVFNYSNHKNQYLINNIEKYEIEYQENVSHTFMTIIDEQLAFDNQILQSKISPYSRIIDGIRYVYYFNEKQLIFFVKHDLKYQVIEIHINPTSTNNISQFEYVMSGIFFLELAMYLGYFPIHSTAIEMHGEVILFSAPSGTGKSTHATYWKEVFPNSIIINDDKPILSIDDNKIMVHGSPFSGEYRLNENKSVPLKAIVFLERGSRNKIVKLSKDEVIPALLKSTLKPRNEKVWNEILDFIGIIYDSIPIYTFYATNSNKSVHVIYNYLFKKAHRSDN